MALDEWRASFGQMFKAAIDDGVKVIMSAHVALPSYMKEVVGETGPNAYLPGSLNRHLNEDLLRGELGFKGLVCSDATPMAGVSGLRRRSDLVVDVLNAGCDVLLGSFDLAADSAAILTALSEGRITQERLDTAILRQLALKASVGAHLTSSEQPEAPDMAPLRAVLEKAPTLVHARDGLLPMTPDRYRKVYVVSRGVIFPPASPTRPLPLAFKAMMAEAGFEVVEHEWGSPVDPTGCDLLLYVYAEECLLTRGSITNDWAGMNGDFINAMSRHWHDMPTLMISFGWPYHLFEAPGVWGYVNAYMAHPDTQKIVLEALMGQRAFEGTSPVDALCGLDQDYFALFHEAVGPVPA
jgi:beta-N-acetylhexosaminidase